MADRAVLYPGSTMRTECLLRGGEDAPVRVILRFLHLLRGFGERTETAAAEALEREVALPALAAGHLGLAPCERPFSFGPEIEGTRDFPLRAERVDGVVRVSAHRVGSGAYRVRVDVENTTDSAARDPQLASLTSAHVRLETTGADFCSLADPPPDLRDQAALCKNLGAWPALLTREAVLSSAIILPDFPALAAESPARRLRPGDPVRIVPRRRADAIDIALAQKRATVVSIEEDLEGSTYVAVTVDDDPGADLGRAGKTAHRFFFHPDEVEPWT